MIYADDNIHDALEKVAAPRHIKVIRDLIQKGERKKAEALIKKLQSAGVLKTTGPGTNIKRLGSGAEGVADLVVGGKGAKGPVQVRKAFDREGPVYSKRLLSEKVQAGRKLRNTDEPFAKLISNKVGKGKTGGRYLLYEEAANPRAVAAAAKKEALKGATGRGPNILRRAARAIKAKARRPEFQRPGRPGRSATNQTALIRSEKKRAAKFGKAKDYLTKNKERGGGRQLMDIKGNPGNTVRGQVVDYLPARTRDVASAQRVAEKAHPGELFGQRNLPRSLQSSAEKAHVGGAAGQIKGQVGVTQRAATKNWVGAPAKNMGNLFGPSKSQHMAAARQQGAIFKKFYDVPSNVGKRYHGSLTGDMSFAAASPRRALSGLGPGSRQTKKIRGQK